LRQTAREALPISQCQRDGEQDQNSRERTPHSGLD
jgi:hypothetical protein